MIIKLLDIDCLFKDDSDPQTTLTHAESCLLTRALNPSVESDASTRKHRFLPSGDPIRLLKRQRIHAFWIL